MSTSKTLKAPQASLARDWVYAVRYWLGGRRGMIALAVVAATAALILNWNWLVTVGLASLLIAALPCVAMCALGLCLNKMGAKSCSTSTAAPQDGPAQGTPESLSVQRAAVSDAPGANGLKPAGGNTAAPSEASAPLPVETSTRRTNDV
jgi:hypothetical protein